MKKFVARGFVFTLVLCALSYIGCSLERETPKINSDKAGVFSDDRKSLCQLGLATCEENTIILCTDGLDNDGDTLIDCDDPGCQDVGTTDIPGPGKTVCPAEENTIYVCNDGIDNDGDGFVDCQDNSCKSLTVCCIPTGAENTPEACSDGIDNDCNGYTDCQDNACKKTAACCVPTGGAENTPEACSDGLDNDCNGYTDCNDNACKKSPVCCVVTGSETTLEACSDGIDNDCNGYVDCGDFACSRSTDPEIAAYCASATYIERTEDTEEKCSDKKDNDMNGLIDCADPDCASFQYCLEAGQEPPARPDNFDSLDAKQRAAVLAEEKYICTDGIDNNRNGLADCDDYNCYILSVRSAGYTGSDANYKFSCQNVTAPEDPSAANQPVQE